MLLDWLRRLFAAGGRAHAAPGMITRICRYCGKTFTLPEEVQHWPDCCQECRAKYRPSEPVTGVCRGCGRSFTFEASGGNWPRFCPDCRAKRRGQGKR